MSEDTYRDSMTSLFNRRYLEEVVPGIVQDFITQGNSFTLAMVDIDHFKTINDLHGHARGDAVLKAFGQFIRETTRNTDTVIRYGGDEMLCILPHLHRQNAEPLLERLLKKCAEHDFDGLKVTLSIGLGSFPDDGNSYEKVFKAADASLYEAKRGGRNRVGKAQRKQITLPIKAFVNRRDELNALLGALGNADGSMRIVVINGNVGVGKTRLSREGLGMLSGREVLWADCLLFNETITYYAIRELIKYRIQRQGSAALEGLPLAYWMEIGKLVPEVMDALPAEAGNPVLDRYRLYESVRRSLETSPLPKVLIIDNFQWIDKESLDVLRYLVRSLKENPHIFLFINRVEEIPEAISEFIADASRETTLDEINVSPLAYPAVQECLRAVIGDEPDPRLVDYVFQTSGGNPYFLEELIRALAADKFLSLVDDQWQFRPPQTEIIPKSIERIALHKYDLLSQEARQVLQFASILGRFDFDLLQSLTAYGESELQALCTQLGHYGLARPSQDRLVFVDELSRRAIYHKFVTGAAGQELHRQVAELLEARYRGKEAKIVDELAYNYYQAGDKEKGVKYCLLAGRLATEKFANESALRDYTWAEKLLKNEKGSEAQRFDVLLEREKVYSLQGTREAQKTDLEALQHLAETLNDDRRRCTIALRRANYAHLVDDYSMAIATADEAIQLAQMIQSPEYETEGQLQIGLSLLLLGNLEEARVKLEQTLALARASGMRKLEANTLSELGNIQWRQGHFAEALAFSEQALAIYHDLGDRAGECQAFNRIGVIGVERGDYGTGKYYLEQVVSITREIGYRQYEATVNINLGEISRRQGDYASAKLYYEKSLQMNREIGRRNAECLATANLGMLFHHLGQNETAREYCQKAIAISQDMGERNFRALSLLILGNVLTALGDLAEATQAYQAAQELQRMLGQTKQSMETSAGLARVALVEGNPAQARILIEPILEFLNGNSLTGTSEEFRCYLTCYRVLQANQDARAPEFLETAHRLLQEAAAKISDTEMRRSFLENVAAHREIVAEFQRKCECNWA